MSDFNYKDYLKNNPLINESKDDEKKSAILDLLKAADSETLLRISDTIGRNTDWVDVDNDTHLRRLTNDIEYDIDQAEGRDIRRLYKDLKFLFPSSLKEDDEPMSDEEIEDLETRADDHFSEPIKETLDDDVWIKVDALKNNLRGEELINVIVKAMSTDDAHLYLDAIMRDYDIDLEDATEDYYNKVGPGTNPENDPEADLFR